MHILAVFGTRPEAIKLAPVLKALRERAVDRGIRTTVCVTAQHRQMLDQVLDLFAIEPDIDLDLMQRGQSPAQVASAVIRQLGKLLSSSKPDWLLVQGDTTTAMAAALAGFYAGVRIGHVEAGLRSGRRREPFPEEINRRIISVLADIHFAPTARARDALLSEGVDGGSILISGNTVIDALVDVARRPAPARIQSLLSELEQRSEGRSRRILLVTAHRRENFGTPLEQICEALRDLAASYRSSLEIVYPVHMNPNVAGPVRRILGGVPNVNLIEPLDYASLVHLMKSSYLVLTDSGGLQEEAPALGRPVLVLRAVTERTEALDTGATKLVGTSKDRIVREVSKLFDDEQEYRRMSVVTSPYGDGNAATRIVDALLGLPVQPFDPGRA